MAVDPEIRLRVGGHACASKPAALVRHLEDKPDERYRFVRWVPDPIDRQLFEDFPTLEMADMAVPFKESEPHTGGDNADFYDSSLLQTNWPTYCR